MLNELVTLIIVIKFLGITAELKTREKIIIHPWQFEASGKQLACCKVHFSHFNIIVDCIICEHILYIL